MRIALSYYYFGAPKWPIILIWQAMECGQGSSMLFVAHNIKELPSMLFGKPMYVSQIYKPKQESDSYCQS